MTMLDPDLENDRVIGGINVGRGTYWGKNCQAPIFHSGEQIKIGRYCSIADNVIISAGGNHRLDLPSTWPFDNFVKNLPNPSRTYKNSTRVTTIGSDVWIGHGAHIGGGVQLGHGSVIGAGAVVFKDVPPYSIVVGNPARILRMRFPEEIVPLLLKISWWDWSADEVHAQLEWFYRPIDEFVKEFGSKAR